MSSLFDAGFDIHNDDHIIIVLDDIFDRGPKPWETYQFIKSIPLSRRILIKGKLIITYNDNFAKNDTWLVLVFTNF